VIAASVAAFVGLGFAVLIVAVLAVVILWLYGSFWITSTVIIVGGHIL
jgi:DnaJ family protein C protein 14